MRLGIVALLAASVAVATCWHFQTAAPVSRLPLELGGVRLSLLQRPLVVGAPHVRAGNNDYLFESNSIRITVGGRADSAESRLRRGGILDVVLKDFQDDQFQQMRTVLSVDGVLVPLDTEQVFPDTSGQKLALVVVQRGDGLLVTTKLELDPKHFHVHLVTTVENSTRGPAENVRVGDRVEWPGTPTYAPRLGYVTEHRHADVAWIAKQAAPLSYALVFDDGPLEAEFLFDHVGPTETIVLGRGARLEAAGKLRYRRTLLVTTGGLARASAAAFSRLGKKLGKVRGRVLPVPQRGVVEVLQPDGKPVTQLELSGSGDFEFSLPVGQYRLALRAPGGVDEEAVRVLQDAVETIQLLPPIAGSLRYTISDQLGRPMPGRLSLRGVPPTKNPDFGAGERAAGVRNVVYSADGQGAIELPPGEYVVKVTRGFEYSIHEQRISVAGDVGASVRAGLVRMLDTSGWIGGDFHLHAAPSFDSAVPLEDRVISLAAEGVQFAVATDHNHVTDYTDAVRTAALESRLAVSSGIEVTTKNWGHFIAFPYGIDQAPPPFEGVDPGFIFSTIRENAPRSVIQVNHPRMEHIAYFAKLQVNESTVAAGDGPKPLESREEAGNDESEADARPGRSQLGRHLLAPPPGFSFDFDTIEVINGFELGKPEVLLRNIADWFALLNIGFRYTAVGNSDSHTLVHQWAGYPRTYVKVETSDLAKLRPDEVASALLYGRAQISNGIFLDVTANKTAGPGDELVLGSNRLSLRVLARAAPWVSVDSAEVWVNGVKRSETRKTAAPHAVNRIQWATTLDLNVDSWVVVAARGDVDLGEQLPGAKGQPFCLTNPIFVDVDGDGVFQAPLAEQDAPRLASEPRHRHGAGAVPAAGGATQAAGGAAP